MTDAVNRVVVREDQGHCSCPHGARRQQGAR
eukprot:CAMPEP_0179147326 /NCGR_PEP_ID=MMETSP0796-20121207/71212_1 /TAXON_ID=73915 /ORGANISM="Pyrodinium bahamense, Strain pbaha01" /LENGTH=30 /DNA_ID= /DNA_START= /DNA_END= /DNA_ORIENTATION=